MRHPVAFLRRRGPAPSAPVRLAPAPSGLPVTGCHAPAVQLFLQPDGAVRPCCRHLIGYGNIAEQRLIDIWQGAQRRDLVQRLAGFDYSDGCENCEREIAIEGWDESYPRFFEVRATHLAGGEDAGEWPRWIDFNLSNACNLQCVQCSGDLSSSIRAHREKRPPLVSPYGDEFFEDLRLFIPHLDGALFAGGEPFMARENYRVWDLIGELRPELHCIVTTNGTQWHDRMRAVLERLRFSFVVSVDSIRSETFAAIRVGADLGNVLTNIDRYRRYAQGVGTTVTINHCLMPQNVAEFGDLLLWAEGEGLRVDVSVVRQPAWCSLSRLPADELRSVHAALLRQSDSVLARLELNARTWTDELARIGSWAAQAGAGASAALDRTIMFFRCTGEGPVGSAAAMEELEDAAHDGVVHVLDIGEDDVITAVSASLGGLVGAAAHDLIGRHYGDVTDIAEATLGPLRRYEVLRRDDDRLDAAAIYGDTHLRMSMLALREDDGVARRGQVLVAVVRPADGENPPRGNF